MFDTHHDLLSICFLSSKYKSFEYLEKMKKAIRNNNIVGVFCNLYFMNSEEMKEEYQVKEKDINVPSMFRESKKMERQARPLLKLFYRFHFRIPPYDKFILKLLNLILSHKKTADIHNPAKLSAILSNPIVLIFYFESWYNIDV